MKLIAQAGPVFPSLAPTQHVFNIAPLEVVPAGLNLIPCLSWAIQTMLVSTLVN